MNRDEEYKAHFSPDGEKIQHDMDFPQPPNESKCCIKCMPALPDYPLCRNNSCSCHHPTNREWETRLREEWKQFTEDDTKNPSGLSFVIMEEDEKILADWWLDKLRSELAAYRTSLCEKIEEMKHHMGDGDDWRDDSPTYEEDCKVHNAACDQILDMVREE